MSVKIGQTIVIKVNQKEYDFILFIREEMPYGRCLLTTHAGSPAKAQDIEKTKVFGTETKTGGEEPRKDLSG
ncbi:hypothetical protein LCGC14_2888010 [marine sediment metagenome]|uniref:Uncharacterized protein n=1 Tax=marine sediment metagenome TaxID=412755 RepID=A0A0F8YJY0_9ZZZZ